MSETKFTDTDATPPVTPPATPPVTPPATPPVTPPATPPVTDNTVSVSEQVKIALDKINAEAAANAQKKIDEEARIEALVQERYEAKIKGTEGAVDDHIEFSSVKNTTDVNGAKTTDDSEDKLSLAELMTVPKYNMAISAYSNSIKSSLPKDELNQILYDVGIVDEHIQFASVDVYKYKDSPDKNVAVLRNRSLLNGFTKSMYDKLDVISTALNSIPNSVSREMRTALIKETLAKFNKK